MVSRASHLDVVILAAIGGTSLQQSKLRDFGAIARSETLTTNKIRRRGQDAATRALRTGDQEGAREAIEDAADKGVPITGQQIGNALRQQALPRPVRAIQSAPPVRRPYLIELYDAIRKKSPEELERLRARGVTWTPAQAAAGLRRAGQPATASIVESAPNSLAP